MVDMGHSNYGWLTVWMLVIVDRTTSLEAPQQEGRGMHLKDGLLTFGVYHFEVGQFKQNTE